MLYSFHAMHECKRAVRAGRETRKPGTSSYVGSVAVVRTHRWRHLMLSSGSGTCIVVTIKGWGLNQESSQGEISFNHPLVTSCTGRATSREQKLLVLQFKTISFDREEIKAVTFDGTPNDPREYLSQFELVARWNGWSYVAKGIQLAI